MIWRLRRETGCFRYGKIILIFSLTVSLPFLMSCGKEPEYKDPADVVAVRDLNVETSTTFQTIAGFGGANQMWGTQFPSKEEIGKAFDDGENGLGFSIFRVRIASNPEEWPLIIEVAKEAQSYGANILASPWSPPASLKTNTDEVGGRLEPGNYQAFVDHINAFLSLMEDNEVDIYAVSVQNEPDIEVSYESCDWFAADMRDFIKEYGSQINVKLAAPESFNFNQSYSDVILRDDEAAANVDIVAGHIYGNGQAPYPLAESMGKEIWMTEYLLNLNTGNTGATPWAERSNEDKWEETFEMLLTLHTAMENNWNAYIWWYLKRYYSFIGDGTEGTTEGEILKRGYAFSHFSNYIRPGYQRVDVSMSNDFGLRMTAYHGDGKTVLVIINESSTRVRNLNLVVDGVVAQSADYYVTNFNRSREQFTVNKIDGNALIDALPESVTTVVIND